MNLDGDKDGHVNSRTVLKMFLYGRKNKKKGDNLPSLFFLERESAGFIVIVGMDLKALLPPAFLKQRVRDFV